MSSFLKIFLERSMLRWIFLLDSLVHSLRHWFNELKSTDVCLETLEFLFLFLSISTKRKANQISTIFDRHRIFLWLFSLEILPYFSLLWFSLWSINTCSIWVKRKFLKTKKEIYNKLGKILETTLNHHHSSVVEYRKAMV